MRDLTDEVLDQLSVGLFCGTPVPAEALFAAELISFTEIGWLRAAGHPIPNLCLSSQLSALAEASRSLVYWTDSLNPRVGFIKLRRTQVDTENAAWLQFLNGFLRAARSSGLSRSIASQFAGVMKEMEDNVHAHSQSVRSGRVAFLAHKGVFEFVVLDRGIGVLASLKQAAEFSELRDHGEALQAATTTGISRFGSNSGRGWGFSDLHTGITNANARARFRSGDHLLQLDGTTNAGPISKLSQRALGAGFVIGIRVHA